MRRVLAVATVCALSLTCLAACGGGGHKPRAAADGASNDKSADGAAGAAAGRVARFVPNELKFTATSLDGQSVSGSQWAGKAVVFWFWTPSCKPCRREAKSVAKVATAYRGKLEFVGVVGKGELTQARKFVRVSGTTDLVQIDDRKLAVYKRFRVRRPSTYVFAHPDGSLTNGNGPLTAVALNRLAKEMLRA